MHCLYKQAKPTNECNSNDCINTNAIDSFIESFIQWLLKSLKSILLCNFQCKFCILLIFFFDFFLLFLVVVRRQFHVHVENTEVYLANSALIKCAIPEYVRPYVQVTSWHRGEEILLPELSDVGKCYFWLLLCVREFKFLLRVIWKERKRDSCILPFRFFNSNPLESLDYSIGLRFLGIWCHAQIEHCFMPLFWSNIYARYQNSSYLFQRQ